LSFDSAIIRCEEILDNARAVACYIAGMDIDAYIADRTTVDAVERRLERISEASRKLGPEAEQLAPAEPWRQIKDLGNALRHEYHKVRTSEIWEIATRDLPSLKADVEKAVAKLRGQGRQNP
jgi:uncharacterized protein with HEPN domain